MAGILTEGLVRSELAELPGWTYEHGEIVKEFTFDGFAEALEFVNAVGDEAEAADHHPDIDIRWNKVTLRLSTHSEGGVTEKDTALARKIEGVLEAPAESPGA
ncbi:MAG TPA: 4a-hydroxytetrahydrobiopterin dehydratase [Armatimonadota bacterium]|jgi:4a-hydroxytetrahydrobiopterin dehydratase